MVEAETEAVAEAEAKAMAEADTGPLDLEEDQAATAPPEWEEGLAIRAHEVGGNPGTLPSTLSKAACVHNESTHPTEIQKSSWACGHKIPQLCI